MRKFSSYGPVDPDLNYYAPRKELIDKAHSQLIGEEFKKGGHYITVWAPRQTGKSWVMQEVLLKLQADERFDVVKLNLEHLKTEDDVSKILISISAFIMEKLGKKEIKADTQEKFMSIFKKDILDKPLVLIIDEFDALAEDAISAIVGVFRNIHMLRQDQRDTPTEEKDYLLHGVALIGVRSVLGVENAKGSPFNVQRSVHIPNLTDDEVKEMFKWYERESGQKVEQEVIDRLYYETRGQPGLTCWFGELLTQGAEDIVIEKDKPVTIDTFEEVYAAATLVLPNNNILNIISKAEQEPYKNLVLELFRTDEKIEFKYDDKKLNFLYMNGVISREKVGKTEYYVKFSSPFVQKRLFNYFSGEIFNQMGDFVDPFENLDDVIMEDHLNIKRIVDLFRKYLVKNREWSLKDAPRRSDMKIYEAVFHFNFYMYLHRFLRGKGAQVFPEFPTGNGQIDLIIRYKQKIYGIELKSYKDQSGYKKALSQAARYGKHLELSEITLVFFIEYIDEENRKKYEVDYSDKSTGVTVMPVFVETGN
ncbi:MAG: AAA family ATPase [bacterium]|nr:AAA family ATPase [bacterium]